MPRPLTLLLSLLPMTLMIACGDTRDISIKDYRLFFHTDDQNILDESNRLVTLFNNKVGFEAIQMMENEADSNSSVHFIPGLIKKDKLGYGQWIANTKIEPQTVYFEGRTPEKTTVYTMAVEFDLEFFKRNSGRPLSDSEHQRLFILFSHEVGHGLMQDHSDDQHDVMFGTIQNNPGIYNMEPFFARVRAFF